MLGTLRREVNAQAGLCCWELQGTREPILPMRFDQCSCWLERYYLPKTMIQGWSERPLSNPQCSCGPRAMGTYILPSVYAGPSANAPLRVESMGIDVPEMEGRERGGREGRGGAWRAWVAITLVQPTDNFLQFRPVLTYVGTGTVTVDNNFDFILQFRPVLRHE
jgi:hypothetical protein